MWKVFLVHTEKEKVPEETEAESYGTEFNNLIKELGHSVVSRIIQK